MTHNDWFMIIFSLVIGSMLLITNVREYKRFKVENEAELKRKKYECFDDSKKLKVLCIVLIVLGIALVVMSIVKKDSNSLALGNMVAFLFAGQFVLTNKRFVMYYNDEAFVIRGKRYSYHSIKEVKLPKYFKFDSRTVTFLNGSEVKLSKGCVSLIQEKMKQKKEAKKNKGIRR